MSALQQFREEGVEARRFEYADEQLLVADFGQGADAAVDVVDGTAIVVVGDEQFDVPVEAGARVFMNNGVLTIEVEA